MKKGITFGAFDLFHAGHILMLEEAKAVCDYLIVCIQSDPSLDRKEKNKPVQSVVEREIQVSACKFVDEILIYDTEQDLLEIIKKYPGINSGRKNYMFQYKRILKNILISRAYNLLSKRKKSNYFMKCRFEENNKFLTIKFMSK